MNQNLAAGFAWAGLVLVLLTSCQKQAPLPLPPVVSQLPQAEAALSAGNYARADELYRAISEGPSMAEREIALGKRALIHALPETPLYSPSEARALLEELRLEFPESTMGTDAEAVLGVLPRIDALREAGARSAEELRASRQAQEQFADFLTYASPLSPQFDIERARAEYRTLIASFPGGILRQGAERILFLISQWDRQTAIASNREQLLEELQAEVSELSEELDKLKEIDLGRRLPN